MLCTFIETSPNDSHLIFLAAVKHFGQNALEIRSGIKHKCLDWKTHKNTQVYNMVQLVQSLNCDSDVTVREHLLTLHQ